MKKTYIVTIQDITGGPVRFKTQAGDDIEARANVWQSQAAQAVLNGKWPRHCEAVCVDETPSI